MLSCLDTEIGIKSCPGHEKCTGYINSLPGITLEGIVSATDIEKQAYSKLWEEIIEESKQSFYLDFVEKLTECRELVKQEGDECDYDKIICRNKKLLHNSWKYKLAATLFEFRLYSSRVNKFTSVMGDEARELMKVYNDKYIIALSQAVKFIDLREESECCMPCSGNPSTVIWLP